MQVIGSGNQHCIGKFGALKYIFPGRESVGVRNLVFLSVSFVPQGNRFCHPYDVHFCRERQGIITIYIAPVAGTDGNDRDGFIRLAVKRILPSVQAGI